MSTTFPGTTIEALSLEKGSSKSLFDGIFATGGITLSQVSIMTGLEPYLIQNWVKRGFVGHPSARVYSREQFARIVIINMLRESMQIEKICSAVGEVLSDGIIGEDELYHLYVDMIAARGIDILDEEAVLHAADAVTEGFETGGPHVTKKLRQILAAMLYAHTSSKLRAMSQNALSSLQ